MATKLSRVNKIKYSDPDPLVLPNTQIVSLFPTIHWWQTIGPVKVIPREAFAYSATVLEECMIEINNEFAKRNVTKPKWKKYQDSSSNYTYFTPQSDGRNLQSVSVKYFPQYVRDIQDEIDTLLADSDIPDTRKAYLARIFCNNTMITHGVKFNQFTKLRDDLVFPERDLVHNALTRAKAGSWPFSESYFTKLIPIKGIGFGKEKHPEVNFNKNQGSIEAYSDRWPYSEIGATTPSGIDGIDIPMSASTRPNIGDKILTQNTSIGIGEGERDYEQGYTYLAHTPLSLHQLRWQPPNVEHWPNAVARRDYVANTYSNITPNKAWYFGQPVEQQWMENWGNWLLKGHVGVEDGQLKLRVYQNPMAEEASAVQCPYSYFYPPAYSNCTCQRTESAYAIWAMNDFKWRSMNLWNSAKAQSKKIGPNTKLKIKVEVTEATGGAGDTVTRRMYIGVRTQRIAGMNDQPFTTIILEKDPSSGTYEVNIQDAMKEQWGNEYTTGGIDAITAISINIDAYVRADLVCYAETYRVNYADGTHQSGMKLPDSCYTSITCTIPDFTLSVDWIAIEEEEIAGDPVDNYK